ncbi:MAG: hypothetical protein M0Q95_07865 [Porticoccaceae bacterium]|nr:hypothetical protein [Porticoccaceae bacterium]
MPDAVKVIESDEQGSLFVNAGGFTLYTYPGDDQPNASNCNDKQYHQVLGQGQNPTFLPDPETRPTCEQAWPPLRAESDASPVGDWSVFERHDGTFQWSYKGKPVYTSMYDKSPGDMTSNRGFLARNPLFAPPDVPASMSARITRSGYVLTGSDGMTLYSGVDDTDPCKDACGREWRPFHAPAMIRLDDADTPWSIEVQADGSRQWARNGKLLYTYGKDRAPGDLQGSAEQGWTPVILSPRLSPPDDISVQMTTEGEVFADKNGMTIYVWNCIDESPDRLPCDTPDAPQVYRTSICGAGETCMNTWRPVVASPGSTAVGTTWTVIPVDPTGAHQYAPADPDVTPLMVWAYQGKPVYTYAGDEEPGDLWGHKIRSFVLWGYSMIKRDLSDY